MKKLYINCILFIIPLLVALTLLPVNRRSMFEELINDCFHHSLWIYDRIAHNKKPIDAVFIGSSHTMNSVNDEFITTHLNNTTVANIGYCRLGTDLQYAFTKDIINHKKPKHLVIEVRESEDRYSHPVFPHLAETKDVLLPNMLFNKNIVSNIWVHYSYKLEVVQNKLYRSVSWPYSKSDYGFSTHTDTISADRIATLEIAANKDPQHHFSLEDNFHLNLSRSYTKKIYELCKENNITLHFIYLPSFGGIHNKPKDYYEYLKYGEVILPPNSIFQNPNNWFDDGHFNISGSTEFSTWLSSYISKNWK